MSNFQNNPAYNHGGGNNGQYAIMTPPPRQQKKNLSLAYTAGGGLLVGIVAGLLLISSGGEKTAIAANAELEASGLAEVDSEPAVAESESGAEPEQDDTASPEDSAVGTAEPVAEAPESVEATIRFDVSPGDIADLEIKLDDVVVTDAMHLLALETSTDAKAIAKSVEVVARAEGYREFKKVVKVKGDMRVAIAMRKVPKVAETDGSSGKKARNDPKEARGNKSGGNKGGGKKSGGGKSEGPGGLLDL